MTLLHRVLAQIGEDILLLTTKHKDKSKNWELKGDDLEEVVRTETRESFGHSVADVSVAVEAE